MEDRNARGETIHQEMRRKAAQPNPFNRPAPRIPCGTHRYEVIHGKAPRGWGLWMFCIAGASYGYTGSFTEARREAAKFARLHNVPTIEVMP